MKEEILDNVNGIKLDDMQKNAIRSNAKSTLIIAGAGSGKTLTIIGKIMYLVNVLNVSTDEILCISFTNETVKSLKSKVREDVDIFTFHKLGLEILKENDSNISICDIDFLEYVVDEYFKSDFFFAFEIEKKVFYFLDLENNKENRKNLFLMDEFKQFKLLLIKFINIFKSNNYNIEMFSVFYETRSKKKRYFLDIVYAVYRLYESELNSNNQIDFNDMLNKATKVVKENGVDRIYKYVIIDEFQDTSLARYSLIKEIVKYCDSKVFCVGDDYQSIYRFTGCDLRVFIDFDKYFNDVEVFKIENTYRNSQELINVCGNFIMKNDNQIEKNLRSDLHIDKPIKIVYYKNIKNDFKIFIDSLKLNKGNILILGRNNKDIKEVYNTEWLNDKVRFLTVHKSKGLEEDSVVLINLLDKKTGFPNKINDNPVLDFVIPFKDRIPYEEERRLFYVALTRTKNNVYIYTKKRKESIFVKELLKNYKENLEIINL